MLGPVVAVLMMLSQASDRSTVSIYPRAARWVPPRGACVRVTVRWPHEREGLDGELIWQYAYPGGSGRSVRQLDGGPREFVRVFCELPPGVTEFMARTCVRGTDKCRVTRETIEVIGN